MKHLSKLLVLLLTLSIILCGCDSTLISDTPTSAESTGVITEAPSDTEANDTEPESTSITGESSDDTSAVLEESSNISESTQDISTDSASSDTTEESSDKDTTDEPTTEEVTDEETTTEETTTEEITTEEITTEEITTVGIGTIPVIDEANDPYENVDKEEFYANYTPAESYEDSYFRTQNKLMSGSIALQDQAPTISEYRPKYNGCYIKNTEPYFTDGGYTYNVVNAYGEVVFQIYKGGAYVTLEEVAAYVFAFGDVPANYSANKKESPKSNPWGEYLRVNHTKFSGNTTKYPYEPELPDISGCGGSLQYYEIDIGTTGTDCDPSYTAALYNNGTSIVRGAARIVYARFDRNGNSIIEFDEKYVFYTYNHYNDFQEYLNYEGGWGEMFGNITGGGTISSKYNYNPTPYVVSVGMALPDEAVIYSVTYYCIDKKSLMDSLFV